MKDEGRSLYYFFASIFFFRLFFIYHDQERFLKNIYVAGKYEINVWIFF